ncbi:hypothetical protein XENTR_v10009193 [Xenopus tropicalis]|nr:hypothetical protein XENTR_v10009193 [Xenopus tropicalis]
MAYNREHCLHLHTVYVKCNTVILGMFLLICRVCFKCLCWLNMYLRFRYTNINDATHYFSAQCAANNRPLASNNKFPWARYYFNSCICIVNILLAEFHSEVDLLF